MTASLDGVERTFKGDDEDYVEERIAVREAQYVKLIFMVPKGPAWPLEHGPCVYLQL